MSITLWLTVSTSEEEEARNSSPLLSIYVLAISTTYTSRPYKPSLAKRIPIIPYKETVS